MSGVAFVCPRLYDRGMLAIRTRLQWIIWLTLGLGLICSSYSYGQEESGDEGSSEVVEGPSESPFSGVVAGMDLSTPRATMRSLLAAARAGDTARMRESFDLTYAGPLVEESSRYLMTGPDTGPDEFAVSAAIDRFVSVVGMFSREARGRLIGPEISQIGDSEFAYPQDLETRIDGQRVVLELLFARGDDNAWRIAEPSLTNADALFDQLDLIRSWLRSKGFGWSIDQGLLGIAYFQWAGLLSLLMAAVVIDLVLRTLTQLVARRYLRRSEDTNTASDTGRLIARLGRTVGLVGGALTVYLSLRWLSLPAAADAGLSGVASVVASLSGLAFAYRFVDVVAEFFARKTAKTDSTFDDLLVPLARKASKLFIFAAGVVAVAEAFDLPITSLVAGLGIGGLAFAFAAKDTIENLFGSVAVVLDRPFNVGDWVVVDGVEGTVEELGFRSTRVRTFYNSLVTVPNSALVRAKVDNYGRRSFRRYKSTLSLTYGTPPDVLDAFCEGVRELIRKHPYTRKDYYLVYFRDFGASSLDVMLYMFFRTPDWDAECRERHKLGLDILRLANELGVEFAFPTQTVELKRVSSNTDSDIELEDARVRGREAAGVVLEKAR